MNEGYKNYYYLLILTSTLYSMSYQCVSKVNLYEFIRNRGVIVSRTSFMRSFVAHSWQSNIFLSSCKHECSTCPKIIIQIPSHLFWTRGRIKQPDGHSWKVYSAHSNILYSFHNSRLSENLKAYQLVWFLFSGIISKHIKIKHNSTCDVVVK